MYKLAIRLYATNSLTIAVIREQSIFRKKQSKTPFLAVRVQFLTFQKNEKTTPDFFDEKSKTGVGFEIGQPQQKCQRRPTLQSLANPAVHFEYIFAVNISCSQGEIPF